MNGVVRGSRVACNAIRTSLFDNVVATLPGLPPRPNEPVVIAATRARGSFVISRATRPRTVQRTRGEEFHVDQPGPSLVSYF